MNDIQDEDILKQKNEKKNINIFNNEINNKNIEEIHI